MLIVRNRGSLVLVVKNLAYMLQEMKYLLRGTRVSKVVEENIKRVAYWATTTSEPDWKTSQTTFIGNLWAERKERERNRRNNNCRGLYMTSLSERSFWMNVSCRRAGVSVNTTLVFVVHLRCCKSESFRLCWHRKILFQAFSNVFCKSWFLFNFCCFWEKFANVWMSKKLC